MAKSFAMTISRETKKTANKNKLANNCCFLLLILVFVNQVLAQSHIHLTSSFLDSRFTFSCSASSSCSDYLFASTRTQKLPCAFKLEMKMINADSTNKQTKGGNMRLFSVI